MNQKFTQLQFTQAKPNDLLALECTYCSSIFYKTKHRIQAYLNPKTNTNGKFCSIQCAGKAKLNKITVICKNCDNSFSRVPGELKKSSYHFCSSSCAATHNNKNKSYGYRRSKLEGWLEEQLTTLYPNLQIEYNNKSAIKSELDIYIPSLNLAFELNGVFHYEPIYGIDKLDKIKANDVSKSKACHEAKIDLCIINTSHQKHVTSKSSQKYLDIITNIINNR